MYGIKEMEIIPLTIISGIELLAGIYKQNSKDKISINGIESPDSTIDGPFYDSLHYKIRM